MEQEKKGVDVIWPNFPHLVKIQVSIHPLSRKSYLCRSYSNCWKPKVNRTNHRSMQSGENTYYNQESNEKITCNFLIRDYEKGSQNKTNGIFIAPKEEDIWKRIQKAWTSYKLDFIQIISAVHWIHH